MAYENNQDLSHDFDALIGSWKVVNRRKKKQYFFLPEQALGGKEEIEWDEFPARSRFENNSKAGLLPNTGRASFLQGRNCSDTV